MSTIEVRTQAELDAALAALRPGQIIECRGSGFFDLFGSASVTASDSASVRAYGSASVRVACPVAIKDMRKPRAGDSMPDKIKAKRVSGPIVEVDIAGEPIAVPA